MGQLISLNIGRPRPVAYASIGKSAIAKQPVEHSIMLSAPGPKGVGGSGVADDDVADRRHHGGSDQAVYAYAREDLDVWAAELGRDLPNGMFGENLTTTGLDVTGALVGERWRVGSQAILEVSDPRIPCRTFAGRMGEPGWIRRFVRAGVPGTYLRVIQAGSVQVGDPIEVIWRPDHTVSVGLVFRALTSNGDLLPQILAADALSEEVKQIALRRTGLALDVDA